jgi:hypothetical protein
MASETRTLTYSTRTAKDGSTWMPDRAPRGIRGICLHQDDDRQLDLPPDRLFVVRIHEVPEGFVPVEAPARLPEGSLVLCYDGSWGLAPSVARPSCSGVVYAVPEGSDIRMPLDRGDLPDGTKLRRIGSAGEFVVSKPALRVDEDDAVELSDGLLGGTLAMDDLMDNFEIVLPDGSTKKCWKES